ncbi:hypothetical protein DL93DRAFT_2234696 [Clavulina sp. PMI_390]|nr:hypothetical protein DL93DRAFT_2234696 [Clavulina sp. PMI_390]
MPQSITGFFDVRAEGICPSVVGLLSRDGLLRGGSYLDEFRQYSSSSGDLHYSSSDDDATVGYPNSGFLGDLLNVLSCCTSLEVLRVVSRELRPRETLDLCTLPRLRYLYWSGYPVGTPFLIAPQLIGMYTEKRRVGRPERPCLFPIRVAESSENLIHFSMSIVMQVWREDHWDPLSGFRNLLTVRVRVTIAPLVHTFLGWLSAMDGDDTRLPYLEVFIDTWGNGDEYAHLEYFLDRVRALGRPKSRVYCRYPGPVDKLLPIITTYGGGDAQEERQRELLDDMMLLSEDQSINPVWLSRNMRVDDHEKFTVYLN